MSTGYQIVEQDALHYVTFQVVKWIDVFTHKVYRDIVIDSLKYCQTNKGLEIYAFVIMSNHIHILLRGDIGKLSDTIREFKSPSPRGYITITYLHKSAGWLVGFISNPTSLYS